MVQDTLAIDNFYCANSHRKNIETYINMCRKIYIYRKIYLVGVKSVFFTYIYLNSSIHV